MENSGISSPVGEGSLSDLVVLQNVVSVDSPAASHDCEKSLHPVRVCGSLLGDILWRGLNKSSLMCFRVELLPLDSVSGGSESTHLPEKGILSLSLRFQNTQHVYFYN